MDFMIFWISVLLVLFVAVFLTARPLFAALVSAPSALELDKALYAARLEEIASDLTLGRIAPDEAEAAKVEAGRKLLELAATSQKLTSPLSSGQIRAVLGVVAVLVPLSAIFGYLVWGNPAMPDMALATRNDRDPAEQTVEQLIGRAEAQLAKNPNDIRGWVVVAPIYMRMGRIDDAVIAWRNALRIEPANAELKSELAETLVVAAQGVVTEEAKSLFAQTLAAQPGEAKARFYLAMALSQQGDLVAAEKAWSELIGQAPEGAPWLEVARSQLNEVLRRAGKPPVVVAQTPPSQAPGPSGEDIAAAQSMTPDQRQEMISGMVDRLATRLKDDPSDKDGWLRLINAYSVMGESEKALETIKVALKANGDDAQFAAKVAGLEAAIRNKGSSQ